jgi:transcriptional regulator with XRE-family HTH domain
MAAPKTLPEPNAADPLSEPTPSRRLWAAYLRAGFTRAQFARRLGVKRYATVVGWDNGAIPEFPILAQACELAGLTLPEYWYGRQQPTLNRAEANLSLDGMIALLDELGATDEQREALSEYRDSSQGKLKAYTRTYVTKFVEAYSAAIMRRQTHERAIAFAAAAAKEARLLVTAIDRGATPVSTAQLRKRGAEARANGRKRKSR